MHVAHIDRDHVRAGAARAGFRCPRLVPGTAFIGAATGGSPRAWRRPAARPGHGFCQPFGAERGVEDLNVASALLPASSATAAPDKVRPLCGRGTGGAAPADGPPGSQMSFLQRVFGQGRTP